MWQPNSTAHRATTSQLRHYSASAGGGRRVWRHVNHTCFSLTHMHTQRAAVRLSVTYSYYDDVTDANKPSLDRIVLPRCTVAHPLLSPPRRLCFHRRLFVCLFVGTIKQKKLRNRCSQNSVERWHMVHGKKILEYGGNPDHFTSGLGPSMRSIWRCSLP